LNKREQDHLIAMLYALEEGLLTPEQARELTLLLESNKEARQVYIQYQLQSASLDLHARQEELSPRKIAENKFPAWIDPSCRESAEVLAILYRQHLEGRDQPIEREADRHASRHALTDYLSPRTGRNARFVIGGGLAAAIALAGTLVAVLSLLGGPDELAQETPDQVDRRVVATLSHTSNAAWENQTGDVVQLAVGEALIAGRILTLSEGFAEITTQRGAIAIIEAPATVELMDDAEARDMSEHERPDDQEHLPHGN